MKTYYITSDIHSFYSELKVALNRKGFRVKNKDDILIVCGDICDRGKQAKNLVKFLTKLKNENRLILIKGNHEWLMIHLLEDLKWHENISYTHYTNGTLGTIEQFSGVDSFDILYGNYDFEKIWKSLEDYRNLIADCKNYYELGNYIFVHGWIPHIRHYEDLADVKDEEWERASWLNGMQEWNNGWKFKDKTIVCGHWHCSWGNYHYHGKGLGEFEKDSVFEPFIDKSIIAIDACTAWTHKVNVLIINDKDL